LAGKKSRPDNGNESDIFQEGVTRMFEYRELKLRPRPLSKFLVAVWIVVFAVALAACTSPQASTPTQVPPTATPELPRPTFTVTPEVVGDPRIAFISDREGKLAIYVMDPDGSDVERVSEAGETNYLFPSWSPDGQRIAYWGTEGNYLRKDDIVADVWVAAADGTERVRVNHDVSNVFAVPPPVWSPDGTRLAFLAGRNPDAPDDEGGPVSTIHIAWTDGGGIEQSIPLPWEPQLIAWSPVGDDLLLVNMTRSIGGVAIASDTPDAGSVYVWSSATGEITEVFQGAEAADWSPDGTEITVGDTEAREVLILGLDGSLHRKIARLGGLPLAVSWSPDGRRIAVGSRGSHKRDWAFSWYACSSLHVFTLGGGEYATVIEQQGRVHKPDWSRDGNHLLFTLTEYGRRVALVHYGNLWSYDVESDQLEQLTDEEEDGFAGLGVWWP
jgi:Tol biopolymer transport system component